MAGYYRIRLVFGIWTIILYNLDMKSIGETKYDNYEAAKAASENITEYMDADKSDLFVGDGKTKSGNLA